MRLLRKIFLPALTITVLFSYTLAARQKPVIWNLEHIKTVKKEVGKSPVYKNAFAMLIADANEILQKPNPSVMNKPMAPASGDKHDYMSLSRYFWPNPKSANGLPYVNRDGESNPELDKYDRNRLGEMSDRVCVLSVAYYFSKEKKYAEKANSMLRTWFIDEQTRVNPNLNFSQVAPGHYGNKGRPSGLIDTYSYITMLDAVALLDQKNVISKEDMTVIKRWFSDLANWMHSSENGLSQSVATNNLSIAYDSQVIRFALFAGADSLARAVINAFPERRLKPQIAADGSQPKELDRTLAFHYSVYNIEHIMDICNMASSIGIDLYFVNDGAIDRSFQYLIPFLGDQKSFPYQQISGWRTTEQTMARLIYRASNYSNKTYYRQIYDRFKAENENYLFTLMFYE